MGPSGPGGTALPSPFFAGFAEGCLDAPSALALSEPGALSERPVRPVSPVCSVNPASPVSSCVPGRALFHADSHPGKTCVGRDILDMSSGERGICAANGHLCHGPWHDMTSRASSAPEPQRAVTTAAPHFSIGLMSGTGTMNIRGTTIWN